MSSNQFAFDLGCPQPAPAIDILYFALLPDEPAATKALAIAERDFADQMADGFIYRPDRLHVSVDKRWQGRGLPDFAVADALRQGDRVDVPAVEIRLDRLVSNGNGRDRPRALTTRDAAPGFSALVRQIEALKRPLMAIPHMTLYRNDRVAPDLRVSEPVSWVARELVLIHARQGAGSTKILARWPLLPSR
ncbi:MULTISPECIES: hypothetical protein [Ensifer]|uniref:2'-5' RNA ligase n=1 Tax=Ensifer adhaerens TaxID=106592 RepID=A0ABY8HGK4_ENSAD|nr:MULTISPECIES: hypothetical protein [Ensifer]ANK74560.1 hypothetical protein FA04_19290 [Ensifer adhaerens]KDP70651.1 hypothetical protein FA04_26180 [Ensifer adhaerens]KQX04814.1 hypothetical protein ASD01_12815 [Ensifer sp. Root423]KQZ51351.1 hypothetical protein ASD63_07110 [Ensifer sp. Root558]MBD9541779.1 hypothetical protein [Ensifer sp. ENS04]